MTGPKNLIDPEIRNELRKIPFGLISGFSTCVCSILLLAALMLVQYFQIFELSESSIRIARLIALTIDGFFVFYELALKKIGALFPNGQQDVTISPDMNILILCSLCFVNEFANSILVKRGIELGFPVVESFLLLYSSGALGALFIGWLSDRIKTKVGIIFTLLVPMLCLFILESPQLLGLTMSKKLFYQVLVLQGFCGCIFVLVKRALVTSGKLQKEGKTLSAV